jgi:hypothetical protein
MTTSWKPRFLFGCLVMGIYLVSGVASGQQPSVASSPSFQQPKTLAALLQVPSDQIQNVEMARMNLLCAEGLVGSDQLDVEKDLAIIDQWATQADQDLQRFTPLYHTHPEKFPDVHSESEWKMYVLFGFLRERQGIGYNPELKAIFAKGYGYIEDHPDEFRLDARDTFLNGIVERRMGVCSSLPAIFVAVGRRLGYPLYYVHTKGHSFVRWDDGKERFNVETTRSFFTTPHDDYYERWPYRISKQDQADFGYLKNQTPQQMLAGFLQDRCACLYASGRVKEGNQAFEAAAALTSEYRGISGQLHKGNAESPRMYRDIIEGEQRETLQAEADFWSAIDEQQQQQSHIRNAMLERSTTRVTEVSPFAKTPSAPSAEEIMASQSSLDGVRSIMMPQGVAKVTSDSHLVSMASGQHERERMVIADLENQQRAAQIKNQQTLEESDKSLALIGISPQTTIHPQP